MKLNASYQDTLDYLYSFVDHSLSRIVRYSPEQFNLDRMRQFMAALGQPDESYSIIHIAGTKGKGSVAAFCSQVLKAANYTVGLYTSPHLIDYSERIQVNGNSIPHETLVNLVEEVKSRIEAIPNLTTFEITTGLALLYFDRQKVDVAVLEVGLGGRLDATNVVTPDLTVITSISYDHTYLLGNTLTEIAAEKAGIVKAGIPLVLAPQVDEARLSIQKIASEKEAPVTQVGRDYLYASVDSSLEGQSLYVWSAAEQSRLDAYLQGQGRDNWKPVQITIQLLGYHQIENAATAYAALQIFRQKNLPIPDRAILDGFEDTVWPGRFEILQRHPPVIIDSAHNRDSARKLRRALQDYFPGYKVLLVFGASEDKDIRGMFAELMPKVEKVIVTRSYHPRAIEPDMLMDLAHQFGRPAQVIPDIADAFNHALRIAGENELVLVTGSLFIAAGAREAWYSTRGG